MYFLSGSKDGVPFNCEDCLDSDKEARNCENWRGLSDAACAIDYSRISEAAASEIVAEHKEKGASKLPPLGGLRMYTCPPLWITDETHSLLDAVYMFGEKGLMPFPGLWTEQPFWFIEAYKSYKRERSTWLESQN